MSRNRPKVAQMVTMALVPLLAVGVLLGLIGSGSDDRIEAAVVNLDEAVTVGDQYIPMGRQLAAAILEREGDNITWTLADVPSAEAGLATGRFAAVVTIPENFSANATSWSANDAAKAEKAGIQVSVSDNAPVTDAQVAEQIARMATDTINAQLTEGYLDGIYVGFNTVGEQFGELTDGVGQLAEGSSQLADGAAQSADGAAQLNDGMSQLGSNAGTLIEGGEQFAEGVGGLTTGVGALNSGASQLAGGARQLADGVAQFAGQAPALASGAGQLADGARQLNEGVGTYTSGVQSYATGSAQFNDGVQALSGGASELASGAEELAGGMGEFADGVDGFAAQTPQLVEGVGELATGGDEYFAGVVDYANGTAALVDGLQELRDGLAQAMPEGGEIPAIDLGGLEELVGAINAMADGATQLSNGLGQMDAALQGHASGAIPAPGEVQAIGGQIAGAYECPVEDAEMCALLVATFTAGADAGVAAGFQAGTGLASSMLNTAGEGGAATLLEGAQQLAGGASQLADEIAAFVGELPEDAQAELAQLVEGIEQIVGAITMIADEAGPLKDGAPLIVEGAEGLNGGLQQLNTEIAALPAGVNQLAAGARALADGSGELAAGARQLSDGAAELATGSTELNAGAQALADGGAALKGGSSSLSDGVGQLADGVAALPAGVRQLETGARGLADGATGLAGGVSELNSGVIQLQDGAEEYVAGVGQYASGVRSAAEGTDALADGLGQLSTGAGELAGGLDLFNTELAAGAEEPPNYSEEDRAVLADVVASPVEQNAEIISASKVGTTALLIIAGLWAGALAAFAIWRPVPTNVVSSRAASVRLWAKTVWLPLLVVVAEGLVLGVIGSAVLGMSAGAAAVLIALMMLLGGSFALANHALAGWLGNIGRAISALLLVVTIGLGLSSALGWLSPVGAVSPLQNGFELIRTHMADGTGEVGLASVALLLGVLALGFSVTAIAAKRRLTASQFRSATAG